MRYLGVDPGGQRLGLAVADDATGTATPLEVIRYRGVRAAAAAIAAAATKHGADRVVVGLPTTADGSETPACRRSHVLANAIAELGLAVDLQPEFLTSNEARRRAREAGLPHDSAVDHLAAQVILEEYLVRFGSARRA
jgi:putative Holliday junction resolvase